MINECRFFTGRNYWSLPAVTVILGLITSITLHAQKDCELRKSENGINVYACTVQDSKLKSIRADFTLPTSASRLAGYILDINSYTQWQYNMIKAEIVKQDDPNALIYHAEVDAPWPVTNRDLVVELKITQDPLTKVMNFSIISIPDYIPATDGVIRIPRSEGRWIVTPVGENQVEVQYSFMVDPGGSIPVWLLNMAVAEGPYKSFSNLIKRIKSGAPVQQAAFIQD
jgi:hypothetical protein